MTLESLPALPGGAARPRPYVAYTLKLVRRILARVADGESVLSICREPGMPSRNTVARWAKDRPKLAAQLEAARRAAGRGCGRGPVRSYCPVTAEEIVGRIGSGETLTDICADPAMPHTLTVTRWRRYQADFDRAMTLARESAAERMCDEGLELARAVTPQTAFADHVKLTHLRWMVTARAPQLFGRTKPMDAPEARRADYEVAIRHFKVETREDGMMRMVSYVADKEAGRVVMDRAGEWHEAPKRLEGEASPGPAAKTGPGSEWL